MKCFDSRRSIFVLSGNIFYDQDNQKKYELDVVKARYETFNDSLQPRGITEIYYPKVE